MKEGKLLEVPPGIKVVTVDLDFPTTGKWIDAKYPPEVGEQIEIEDGAWYRESKPVLIYTEYDPEENPTNIWIAKYWVDSDGVKGFFLIGENVVLTDGEGEVEAWMQTPEGYPEQMARQMGKSGPVNWQEQLRNATFD